MSAFEDVVLGRRTGSPRGQATQTFVEGRIKSVSAAGATFTIPSWDEGRHVFGPAPWPMSRVEPAADGHDHAETGPPQNARCLVVFLGTGVDRPWILGWWNS